MRAQAGDYQTLLTLYRSGQITPEAMQDMMRADNLLKAYMEKHAKEALQHGQN